MIKHCQMHWRNTPDVAAQGRKNQSSDHNMRNIKNRMLILYTINLYGECFILYRLLSNKKENEIIFLSITMYIVKHVLLI